MTTTIAIAGRKWATLNGPRSNPHAHNALMQTWRALAHRAATDTQHAGQPTHGPGPVHITATVHRTTNARSDAHNVIPTIKACIDGIVDAGTLDDDHDGIVTALTIRRGTNTPTPTITINIERTTP